VVGLPGLGLVANIAVNYLIKKLNAKVFCEIGSSSFQNIAYTSKKGSINVPYIRFYYLKGIENKNDLILLYGNTQALTTNGQYELCGCILDIVETLKCKYILTLGGYKPGKVVERSHLYYAASDLETGKLASKIGGTVLEGKICGLAGLLIGLAKLRAIKGFCLLSETVGNFPDIEAARFVLKPICKILKLKIDLTCLKNTEVLDVLPPFDFGALTPVSKKKDKPKWFI
jgi:uncharacterized protein (TIGR00162 family)